MAVCRCKMCGGALEAAEGKTYIFCAYCGTQQTLPRLDDEHRANLYDRANHFRRNNEFDKAMGIYEQILNEDTTDAEAYWSLVLCRYGIEYVEDPATRKRIPTVNRAQYTSVYDDDNYKSALACADVFQKPIYEEEAAQINEIQKGILAISQKEEPFDVFICYKETDANGRRTPDSVLANDLYHQLTQEGFKVFFSRITLEDKLGTAYEPYIFAALNSAKVMVVLGTKPEYFNAVWVKNEWSRYLALIKQGQQKILIPAYKDMDPYDLPEEFSHLQAQDMSKLGFMQDLIRGIRKLAQPAVSDGNSKESAEENTATAPLLRRAFLFLEDEDWDRADEYCEKVLDIDPECAEAYLGKLMAELGVPDRKSLKDLRKPFDQESNYKKIIRFGDEQLKQELQGYVAYIKEGGEAETYTVSCSICGHHFEVDAQTVELGQAVCPHCGEELEFESEDDAFNDDSDYVIVCPSCNHEFSLDAEAAATGEAVCPNCEQELEFDIAVSENNTIYYARIEIERYGNIMLQLDTEAAPITVENFVDLAESGFYNGLTFHRIMKGFMIQGGDPLGNGTGGSKKSIVGEFAENGYDNDISHVRGVISMARSAKPDSASSQFFIVHEDSTFLDGKYAAFGWVTKGMEVVDAICDAAKPIDNNGTVQPIDQPRIQKIKIFRYNA
ncbi:MAG: peptidylprolyl isomerase [Clostridia bacterium]|nr:peptidylprolyl isomerase [Clostridia bacterium]